MKQVLKRAKLPASAISPDKKQPKLFLFQYACFPVSTMSRWMKRSLFLSLMAFTLLPTGIGRAYGQQSLFKDTAGVAVISRLGAWIPDSVQLKGSAQGMAIHRHQAFLLRDGHTLRASLQLHRIGYPGA